MSNGDRREFTLVFVYNADSGVVNTLLDIGHKIFSPHTYSCRLCAITHTTFSMREPWKSFLQGLGVAVEFLHRDEFMQRYALQHTALPAIFRKTEARLEEWISREDINKCQSLADLEQLVEQRLRA